MIVRTRSANQPERHLPNLPWHVPFGGFELLRRELDRVLFRDVPPSAASCFEYSRNSLEFSLKDDGASYILRAQVPGLLEKDIDVSATTTELTIHGARKDTPPDGYTVARKERAAVTFERTLRLPEAVDPSKVEARLADGMLTVTLPKAEQVKPRSIIVQTS
jgi:HSP20 family protein